MAESQSLRIFGTLIMCTTHIPYIEELSKRSSAIWNAIKSECSGLTITSYTRLKSLQRNRQKPICSPSSDSTPNGFVPSATESDNDMSKPRDNCDSCGQDYKFEPDKDFLHLFIETPECNHILATCPFCDSVTRIFAGSDAVMLVVMKSKLSIRLAVKASADLIDAIARLNGYEPCEQLELDLPPLNPLEWRELGNDIRRFEHDESE